MYATLKGGSSEGGCSRKLQESLTPSINCSCFLGIKFFEVEVEPHQGAAHPEQIRDRPLRNHTTKRNHFVKHEWCARHNFRSPGAQAKRRVKLLCAHPSEKERNLNNSSVPECGPKP